jgi:hypothetical protein
MRKGREDQMAKFGKIMPVPSGHCYLGECPISVPTPRYTDGPGMVLPSQVKVETIVGEDGSVVYARVIKGHPLLRRYALEAAYKARHVPRIYCEKPVKYRWTITYNFIFE